MSLYLPLWSKVRINFLLIRAQSFTSLKNDLLQDISCGLSFRLVAYWNTSFKEDLYLLLFTLRHLCYLKKRLLRIDRDLTSLGPNSHSVFYLVISSPQLLLLK